MKMMIHNCSSAKDNSLFLFISLLSKSLRNENWICLTVKVVLIRCNFKVKYSPKWALRSIYIACFVSQKNMNKRVLMGIWMCKAQTKTEIPTSTLWSKCTGIQSEERHLPRFTIRIVCFISLISSVILFITDIINTFICIFVGSSLSVIVRYLDNNKTFLTEIHSRVYKVY